jgi:hypothetical protein
MDSITKARDRSKAKGTSIRFKTTMHGTVVWQVMLWRGWTEVEDDYDWDVFWCASEVEVFTTAQAQTAQPGSPSSFPDAPDLIQCCFHPS